MYIVNNCEENDHWCQWFPRCQSTIRQVWIDDLKSNTSGILQPRANDVNPWTKTKKLSIEACKLLGTEVVSRLDFLDNDLKLTRTNPSKEGHNESHIDETKPVIRDWFDGTTEHKLTQRVDNIAEVDIGFYFFSWTLKARHETWQHWLMRMDQDKITTLNSITFFEGVE